MEEREKERETRLKAEIDKKEEQAKEREAKLEEKVRGQTTQIDELNSKMDCLFKHLSPTLPQEESSATGTNRAVFFS
jgi:hypothetical protein